jgi:hypothetical protein
MVILKSIHANPNGDKSRCGQSLVAEHDSEQESTNESDGLHQRQVVGAIDLAHASFAQQRDALRARSSASYNRGRKIDGSGIVGVADRGTATRTKCPASRISPSQDEQKAIRDSRISLSRKNGNNVTHFHLAIHICPGDTCCLADDSEWPRHGRPHEDLLCECESAVWYSHSVFWLAAILPRPWRHPLGVALSRAPIRELPRLATS